MIGTDDAPLDDLRLENRLLTEQIKELLETIRAIREGEVDALIVDKDGGKRVFTLQGADHVYQEVVEGMSEGALTFNTDGLILYANEFFGELVGIPVRNVVGTFVHDHFVSSAPAGLAALMADAKVRRTRGEILLRRAGELSPTLLSMRQLDVEGMLVFCAVVTDLTMTKENEEARIRTIELTRANQELGQFAYVSSHDLQEPLRKISTYAQLLQSTFSNQLGPVGQKFLKHIADSSARMRLLVQALMTYSQLGEKPAPSVKIDLNAVLSEVFSDLELAIVEADIKVTSSPLPVVSGDPVRFRQLFQNILSNAIKYRSPVLPRINVSARYEGEEWIVAIQDNGIGIEPTYFEQIFKVFNRVRARPAGDGTGMGLAICKKIVEQHRGRIWVTSALGSGSTFFFSIPA